ncbi:MAG TPA: hypothetical protein VK591_19570 [Xanthobacteraceae bacterium]|nr:hypothetical protein [Xanthobacteraceae bacterium]
MKRAIVWFCWGERFIGEAIDSARSAAAIDADRVLITDAEGAQYAKGNPAFTSIVQTQLLYSNNLEKSRLVDLLPGGYDTFLYLDTDAKIVGDVSLGFAKAERHGIAMAPAPNYNLPEFFNFARIMRELGTEPADQIMYNSGVIFFHLTAAVRQMLERWRDLCATVGAKSDFPRDQPFLNLALEQSGFTPYVLSPLYNYRGLGEYAVGNIRIWHSHLAPPPDLNEFENAWPARRFIDGMQLDAGEGRSQADRRRPQAMSELSLSRLNGQLSPRAARRITTEALAIARGRGSRAASDFVLHQIGIHGSPDNSDSYFTEAMHYHLGLLHAHSGNPTEMAPHLTDSHTMPNGESDLLFSDHVNLSYILRDRQLAAMKRGVPPILIACMPRSASATLTYTLARAVDIPVLHISAGNFPDRYLVPSWLNMFLEGGAITQDHFAANDFNIGVLQGRGPRDIFVLIRDPRAAARSQVHHLARGRDGGGELLARRIERQCIENFIPWLQAWIDCADNKKLPFRIHWLTYGEACRDPGAILRKIAGVLGADNNTIAAFAYAHSLPEERMHFVDGHDDAWRREVGSSSRDLLWQACTAEMKAMLDLRW